MRNPITTYITEVKSEVSKVSWPTKKETIRLTVIVVVVSAIVATYLGALDFLLSAILKLVLS
ncbi:preprotein translocase subunit SecE [Candidatus Parcubacteria bacterium]|nr:preprotein translocase subunit SecE [Patescibacteria group bacterium]MBU4380935.1 preprotein translocase subunit SecE [Patescibacteria group bacterium]MCG2689453.1 preprotein translocase subunit SecE [Candidatus Parcubacteria bacterium]